MNNCVFTLMSYLEKADNHSDLIKLDQIYRYENGSSFFDANESEENLYLVCHHDEYGIIGAAKLSPPQSPKAILNDYFKENNYEIKEFWQISHILFAISGDEDIHEDATAFNDLCKTFYKELSKTLALIGLEQDIQTWLVLNYSDDHEDTKYFGNWPYSIEHHLPLQNNLVFGCLENKKLIPIR